jgi:hypothetical protein
VRKWLGFSVLLIIVNVGAEQFGRIAAERQNTRDASNLQSMAASHGLSKTGPDSEPEIIALVTTQPSDGVTEAQLDNDFLDGFGRWVAERHYANAVKHQQMEGGLPILPVTPESVFVHIGKRKLVIVRLRTEGVTPFATILGIEGENIVRVTCISRTMRDIPISFGPCGAKVKETFGELTNQAS